MTWAKLIREYYRLCMESGCAIDLMLDTSEAGAHYIFATAHNGKCRNSKIIGYVGLGVNGVEGRMMSYDDYKDADTVVNLKIEQMVSEVREGGRRCINL